MRALVKLGIVVVIAAVLAVGLVPPLLAQGALDTDAVNAARSASAALVDTNSPDLAAAQTAAQTSVAGDEGVEVKNVSVNGQTVEVTLTERVHTFMSGMSWMKGYFELTSTKQSTLGD